MIKAHVVSHTHWDMEWYKPSHHFVVRLIYMMDSLINVLENNPAFKSFMLDGQTIMLEDYLSIKPEMEQRVRRLIEDGKLIVGPWYTQPDEFVPDGESHIRNLLIGHRISAKFGKPMKVGYLPDSFGQSAQMPQILKGFGIATAAVWRGIPFNELQSSEFIWQGLNGEEVLGIYLTNGYAGAMFLPTENELADERMQAAFDKLKQYSPTGNLLIMHGTDHQWVQPHITDYIEHLNQTDQEIKYIHSTLEEYADTVRNAKPVLKLLQGELLAPEKCRVHGSIVSVRLYQKQENRKTETLLEKYIEPVCALGWLNGAVYPKDLINSAWKYLLANQAHDSIGGCCLDEAHKEVDQRFRNAQNIGETLLKSYSRAIARNLAGEQLKLVVFNTSLTCARQLVKATLYLDDENFILTDGTGNSLPYQLDKVTTINAAALSIWSALVNLEESKKQIEISFYVDFNFNVGYKVFNIVEGVPFLPQSQQTEPITIKNNQLETRFHEIKVQNDGTLWIKDKLTDRIYDDLLVFEDCGNAGDTYNFSPVKEDTVITSKDAHAQIEIVKQGRLEVTVAIRLQMEVPLKLVENDFRRSKDKVTLPITTYMTVYADTDRIDFKTEIQNNVFDHRLRVLLPTSVTTEHSFAEVQFGTLRRNNKLDDSRWMSENWVERPLPIYSQHKFVDVNDGQFGLAVLNKGLTEYEIYEQGGSVIALTLLSGVGQMGKRNLLVRPGRPSGIEMPTPDAQCLGLRMAEYSLVTHQGTWNEANIPQKAIEFNATPLAVQSRININNIPENIKLYDIETLTRHVSDSIHKLPESDYGLFQVSNKNLLISTVKKAEDEENLIIRLYNSGDKAIANAHISFAAIQPAAIVLTDFNEAKNIKSLETIDGHTFVLPEIASYTAVTLKARLK